MTPNAASTVSSKYTVLSLTTLIPSPSRLLLLIDINPVVRNVVLQMLDFLLQLPNPIFNLCLEAMRGAFTGSDCLPVDNEEAAALRWATVVVVEFGVDTSPPSTKWRAKAMEGRGLRFTAAFEGEYVVETHG